MECFDFGKIMHSMTALAIYGTWVHVFQYLFTTVIIILSAICISDFCLEFTVTTEHERHLSLSVPLGAALLRLPT